MSCALGLVLAGCSGQSRPGDDSQGPFTVDVDVDTPQLRTAKRQAGIEDCQQGTGAAPEGGLPDLALACLGGGPEVNLSRLEGPLVLNLWASWCAPCRDELPYYQQLHERSADKVAVLGIDYQDTQPAAALDVARQAGVTYPLLADPAGSVRVPFRVARGLPGVVFVDGDETITHVEYVVIDSYGQLRDLAEQHLDVAL